MSIVLQGWSCKRCGVFNGEEKEPRASCRSCAAYKDGCAVCGTAGTCGPCRMGKIALERVSSDVPAEKPMNSASSELIVHYATTPFRALCGADESDQRTAQYRALVTCSACLAKSKQCWDAIWPPPDARPLLCPCGEFAKRVFDNHCSERCRDERRASDDPLRELARKAVEAQDARKDEDVDAWAARLAADSVATGEAEYGPDYPSNRRSETATVDHLKCDVACSLECDAVNRFGDVKIERPRPGRIRIIRRFRSRKDEQVEVDEAWLIDVLRRPTATDPPVRNKPYDFAERARFFVDRVQSGWATGEQRMQGIIDLANMFCEVANVAREDAEQGARRRERATDPEQARNDALDEAAKVAVDEELWTEEPGRLSEFERRIVVGALQSVARGIRALKRERAAPSSSDPKEGG
jgi:hypothetical protein